jgi:hypothetical protein
VSSLLFSFSADQGLGPVSKSFAFAVVSGSVASSVLLPGGSLYLPVIAFAFGNRNSSLGLSGLASDDVTFEIPKPLQADAGR